MIVYRGTAKVNLLNQEPSSLSIDYVSRSVVKIVHCFPFSSCESVRLLLDFSTLSLSFLSFLSLLSLISLSFPSSSSSSESESV